MRTGRSLTECGGGGRGGASFLGGSPCQGVPPSGDCLLLGGAFFWAGSLCQGVSFLGGASFGGSPCLGGSPSWGVSLPGVPPFRGGLLPGRPPPVDRIISQLEQYVFHFRYLAKLMQCLGYILKKLIRGKEFSIFLFFGIGSKRIVYVRSES